MSWIDDAWDWTKGAADWAVSAADDISSVLADFGTALDALFGGGKAKDGKVPDTPIKLTQPGTWSPLVWVGVIAGVVFLGPPLFRGVRRLVKG